MNVVASRRNDRAQPKRFSATEAYEVQISFRMTELYFSVIYGYRQQRVFCNAFDVKLKIALSAMSMHALIHLGERSRGPGPLSARKMPDGCCHVMTGAKILIRQVCQREKVSVRALSRQKKPYWRNEVRINCQHAQLYRE